MKATYRPLLLDDWPWVRTHLSLSYTDDTKGFVVEDENGERVAAAIFRDWSITSVAVHQYIGNPLVLRHGYYEEIANYVYVTADRATIYGPTPSDNLKAIKLNKHIGFTEEARLKDSVMFGVDLILFRLDKNDCRFLPDEYKDQWPDDDLEEVA